MIELHYIEAILLCAMWIISIVIAYGQGMNNVIDKYEDAVKKWGETVESYRKLHIEYKKLLEKYKSQSEIHMN